MPAPLVEPSDLPWRARAIGLALLAAMLACAALAQAHFVLGHPGRVLLEESVAHRTAALCWLAALVVPTVALCLWTRRWRLPGWPGHRGWAALLVLLVLFGGWLRFHRLDELPPGLWIDEALNGVQAQQIAAAGWPLVALPEEDVRTGLGAGFVDIAGLAFRLVDPLDGPYAIRAVAVVIGIAGVAAVAALAWVLFGARAALAATAWLAVSQYHLNYSRWGEMPILSSVIETLACLMLALGVRSRGWRAWGALLAAGALTGAGLYSYQTFRLFIVLSGAAGLFLAFRHRRTLGPRWAPALVGLLLAGAVALPMVQYALTQPEKFGERAGGTLILGRPDWRQQLAESLPRSLLAFQFVGDDNPRHNLPYAPLLTVVPALLAPIGLMVCLARSRRLTYALVPVWWLFTLVPAVITLEAPHATRLLDGIVPLALMVGVAVDFVCGVLQAALPMYRLGLVLGATMAALAAAVMARQETRAYFVEREQLPSFVDAFFPEEAAPGRYLAAQVPNATVYLDPGTYYSPTTRFIAWKYLNDLPADVRMLRLLHDFPPRQVLERDALFLLSKPYLSLAALIQGLAPSAACEDVRDAFGRLDMTACRVPAAALSALRLQEEAGALRWPYGLRARIDRDGDGQADVEGMLPFGFLDYTIEDPPLGRFAAAELEGLIDIPVAGEYLFRLHPDGSSLTIDGQTIIAHPGEQGTGGGHEGRAKLPAGRLPIHITLAPGTKGHYFLWFLWQPPRQDVALVPTTVLHPPEPSDR